MSGRNFDHVECDSGHFVGEAAHLDGAAVDEGTGVVEQDRFGGEGHTSAEY